MSYQDRAAAEVLSLVAASSAVLLDPWSTELLDVFGLGASARRSAAADLGIRLLAPLPTVTRASISEILDLRRELQGPLIRFRSAMATAAKEMPDASVEREDFVTAFIDEQVAPALLEIDERTRENSFVSQLLDVVKDPKEMAVPAGGLLVASGAGITGVLGVVSGLTGMTIPVLRTLVRTSREKQEIARNPFYFLHRLDSVHAR